MRIHILAAAAVLLAGCASQPSTTATSATPAVAPVAAAPTVAPAAANAEPKTVQQAQAAGYKIVNQNGKTVYCREQKKTGSHVRSEMVCLTAEELEAAREASRRNLDQMQRAIPPPQGT